MLLFLREQQVAHPKKIAVGGHSYGAFMTANLLAHAPHLFACGIARAGAYNRTLTPFGFQVCFVATSMLVLVRTAIDRRILGTNMLVTGA